MDKSVEFRYAERKDISLILQFVRELAEYEKMADLVATLNGGVLIGTSRALTFIFPSVQSQCQTGRLTALREKPSKILQRNKHENSKDMEY